MSSDTVDFPFMTVPSDVDLKRSLEALAILKEKDRPLYEDITWSILSSDNYQQLRLFTTARCQFRIDLKNISNAKAANTTVFIPNVVAYLMDGDTIIKIASTEKLTIGDFLPNEARAVKNFTRDNCPSLYAKANNERIYVSFDGGLGELDFFSEFSGLQKFFIRYEFIVFAIAFLIFGSTLYAAGFYLEKRLKRSA